MSSSHKFKSHKPAQKPARLLTRIRANIIVCVCVCVKTASKSGAISRRRLCRANYPTKYIYSHRRIILFFFFNTFAPLPFSISHQIQLPHLVAAKLMCSNQKCLYFTQLCVRTLQCATVECCMQQRKSF